MYPEALVSVYIPTKNRVQLLQRAVDSVLSQTYNCLELFIVNDGSSDGTYSYLESLRGQEYRVRVIHNSVSLGAPRSRNLAIQAASGEFVTGLDDDDRFHPDRVAALVRYWQVLERAGERFSCLFTQDVFENATRRTPRKKDSTVHWRDLFFFNSIGNQIFARREAFIAAGLFDADMPAWQDLDLFIRILRTCGPAKLLDDALYITNLDPRAHRISVDSRMRVLSAYLRLAEKWSECPRVMLQGLCLQRFGPLYADKPTLGDLAEFFRLGLHIRTLRSLAGLYLRRVL